jgi:hypothetical protein
MSRPSKKSADTGRKLAHLGGGGGSCCVTSVPTQHTLSRTWSSFCNAKWWIIPHKAQAHHIVTTEWEPYGQNFGSDKLIRLQWSMVFLCRSNGSCNNRISASVPIWAISNSLYSLPTQRDFTLKGFESTKWFHKKKKKKLPWPESTSELYRSSDRRLSAKLVPNFLQIEGVTWSV